MHHENQETQAHGSIASYCVGFLLSIALSIASFYFISEHIWSGHTVFSHAFLYVSVVVLALIQLCVQLYFFLHLGAGTSGRLNIAIAVFALMVLFILVGGTLWIMNNLQHGNMDDMFQNGIVTPQAEED